MDPEYQTSLPPGHFHTEKVSSPSAAPHPQHSTKAPLAFSLTGQDPGQTLPPSKSESPPLH